MLATAGVDGNPYALAITALLARRSGWEPDQITALRSGGSVGEPAADALLTVVRETAGSGGRVSDATWARAVAAGCTDHDLAEAFAYLGLTVFTAYFLNYADTELDVPVSSELGAAGGRCTTDMELVQSRIVTGDVERLAAFYARLIGVSVTLNEYYVEVNAGPVSVGFSKHRFTEYHRDSSAGATRLAGAGAQDGRTEVILDFRAGDVDAEYERITALGVEWVLPPTAQPRGNRNMIFRDPGGNLINVFSQLDRQPLPE
jgi:predicted enzyme related to lactoylglutathione lyase